MPNYTGSNSVSLDSSDRDELVELIAREVRRDLHGLIRQVFRDEISALGEPLRAAIRDELGPADLAGSPSVAAEEQKYANAELVPLDPSEITPVEFVKAGFSKG